MSLDLDLGAEDITEESWRELVDAFSSDLRVMASSSCVSPPCTGTGGCAGMGGCGACGSVSQP